MDSIYKYIYLNYDCITISSFPCPILCMLPSLNLSDALHILSEINGIFTLINIAISIYT